VFGTGTLESKVVVAVSAKIVGKVIEVRVDQGDTVAAGQLMARLENEDFEDAARVAATQCEQARAELDKAEAEARRHRYTRILSPSSGLVITRNLEMGATVVPGTPIFRIATAAPWVVAQVDEHATGTLSVGQPARVVFQVNSSVSQSGHVARLAQEADRVTEEREVDVTVDQLPTNHFLGQRADVYIESARKEDALQVPRNALAGRDGKAGVFVVDGGRARWRPVQLGLEGRTAVEILSGVSEHDLVILDPSAGDKPITDGARVAVASGGQTP
jgi:HlyD family secretion protein